MSCTGVKVMTCDRGIAQRTMASNRGLSGFPSERLIFSHPSRAGLNEPSLEYISASIIWVSDSRRHFKWPADVSQSEILPSRTEGWLCPLFNETPSRVRLFKRK